MNMLPIIYALLACALVFVSGLLFGGRRGKKASQELIDSRFEYEKETAELRNAKGQLESALAMTQGSPNMGAIEGIENMLAPIARTHSIRSKIEGLDTRGLTRNDLSTLLTQVSQSCGFSTCVLVDTAGLPIAASEDASNVEVLSGLSAVFHQLAIRTKKNGRPMPNAFIHRDEENQLTLARLVPVDDEYFTILAIMQGNIIGPDTLDPLVPVIRKVLKHEPWAS